MRNRYAGLTAIVHSLKNIYEYAFQLCIPSSFMGSTSAKSRTRLSDFPFTFHFHALVKEMATHSSVLALENPRDSRAWWAALYRVGHD